jgi:fructokinase
MVCVIGEALIDLAPDPDPDGGAPCYRARPGGSPFNVAIGLARLGHRTTFQARISDDIFGRQLRAHAVDNGLDLSASISAEEPTTLAVVGLDAELNATYDFYVDGTADWQWTLDELALAGSADWIHHGSLAAWTKPGSEVIADHLTLMSATGSVISYDPNIRPKLMGNPESARNTVEISVGLSHVVKASAEDLAWLYPGLATQDIIASWLELGPGLVVVTDGPHGAHAGSKGGQIVKVPGQRVRVVDTVGAGDAFMAGLIDGLIRARFPDALRRALSDGSVASEVVEAAVNRAGTVAAMTVSRAGADPPTTAELIASLTDESR